MLGDLILLDEASLNHVTTLLPFMPTLTNPTATGAGGSLLTALQLPNFSITPSLPSLPVMNPNTMSLTPTNAVGAPSLSPAGLFAPNSIPTPGTAMNNPSPSGLPSLFGPSTALPSLPMLGVSAGVRPNTPLGDMSGSTPTSGMASLTPPSALANSGNAGGNASSANGNTSTINPATSAGTQYGAAPGTLLQPLLSADMLPAIIVQSQAYHAANEQCWHQAVGPMAAALGSWLYSVNPIPPAAITVSASANTVTATTTNPSANPLGVPVVAGAGAGAGGTGAGGAGGSSSAGASSSTSTANAILPTLGLSLPLSLPPLTDPLFSPTATTTAPTPRPITPIAPALALHAADDAAVASSVFLSSLHAYVLPSPPAFAPDALVALCSWAVFSPTLANDRCVLVAAIMQRHAVMGYRAVVVAAITQFLLSFRCQREYMSVCMCVCVCVCVCVSVCVWD